MGGDPKYCDPIPPPGTRPAVAAAARCWRVDVISELRQPLPALCWRNARRGNCEASEDGVVEREHAAMLTRSRLRTAVMSTP
jgi:hypothetical protein